MRKGKVVVEFYSPRCKSCKVVGEILEDVLRNFEDVELVRVNVLENRELARSFGVIAIPVIVAMRDGVEVGRLKGAKTKSEIESFLTKAFS